VKERVPIERASANDLMERATDAGPAPMQVGAVLVLGPSDQLTSAAVTDGVDRRSRAIPRLRQVLVDAPFGCGRAYWADDEDFAIEHHVRTIACPAPGDEAALLALASDLLIERLPTDRPLWSVTLVTGLVEGGSALVTVFHHVLADGIGGLAVLAGLVDGAAEDLPVPAPSPPPCWTRLLVDATRTRLHAVTRLPTGVRRVRAALAEFRRADTPKAARTSLNRPTGPRRALATARVDLAPVLDLAHQHGATVNDVLLTAVAGALRATLVRRGEAEVPEFVISVPVSGRRATGATELGNDVSVRPVAVPALGDPLDRLGETARRRPPRDEPPVDTAVLMDPALRLLAALRLLHWLTDHQRMVNGFVSNLRGPGERLAFLGAEVREVIPVSGTAGNVTVAFAALSYAGTLRITLIADPDACPDLTQLRDDLQGELDLLVSSRGAKPV
jgi:diacylglycerol O-acyltransferase / wax synthase